MKINTHFLIAIILSMFIFLPSKVYANFGDLRYEVTDFTANENKIVIKGWAFIHKTNNYVTVYRNNNKNNSKIAENGGQKVKIAIYLGDEKVEEKENTVTRASGNSEWIDYNFYTNHFYNYASGLDKEAHYNDIAKNTCKSEDEDNTSQCYYQDVYFSITFNLTDADWVNEINETNNKLSFKISVTNAFYQKKEGEGKWVQEDLIVTETANIRTTNFVEEIETSNKVKFIAIDAMLRNSDDTKYKYDGESAYGENGGTYTLSDYKVSLNKTFLKAKTADLLKIKIDSKRTWLKTVDGVEYYYIPSGDESKSAYAYETWLKPTGTFYIKVDVPKKCKVSKPTDSTLSCNGSKTFTSTCNELTVTAKNGNEEVKADVTITETGTISNVLTPTKTFAGGPFSFGVIYRNELTWDYIDGKTLTEAAKKAITDAMKARVNNLSTITDQIKTKSTIKLGNEKEVSLQDKLYVNCSQEGSFEAGKTLVTYCTIFLPTAVFDSNNNLSYNLNSTGSINNQYYTPTATEDYSYQIKFNMKGLNVLKETYLKSDSETGDPWTGTWNNILNNKFECGIKLYPLLTTIDQQTKVVEFNYLYRPIDITNPFPNRNPGINWYDWWEDNNNKKRLESTYSNLQYSVSLGAKEISSIKQYNKSNKDYATWNMDKNGNSKFINENSDMFDTLRKNIIAEEGEG